MTGRAKDAEDLRRTTHFEILSVPAAGSPLKRSGKEMDQPHLLYAASSESARAKPQLKGEVSSDCGAPGWFLGREKISEKPLRRMGPGEDCWPLSPHRRKEREDIS